MNNDNIGVSGREIMPEESDGMGIKGQWINKRTGQTINVRNAVQDGNQMIIISDKGQIPMDVFSRDYIQGSNEIYNEQGQVIGQEEFTAQEINYPQSAEFNYQQYADTPPAPPAPQEDPNEKIIKKIFDKLSTYPEAVIDIKWDDFPEAQLKTLTDFLDIDLDSISKYILKNYLNEDKLAESISKMLEERLGK